LWRPLHSTACNALLKYRVGDGMDEKFRLGPGVGKVKVVRATGSACNRQELEQALKLKADFAGAEDARTVLKTLK
jgi:hypothetical protein